MFFCKNKSLIKMYFLRFFKGIISFRPPQRRHIYCWTSSKETYILLDLLKGDIYIAVSPQRRHFFLQVSSDRGDLDEQQKPGEGNEQEGKKTGTTKARHAILFFSESHCGTAATKTLSTPSLLPAGTKVFIVYVQSRPGFPP